MHTFYLSKINNGVKLPQDPLNALNVILSHCIKRQRNIVPSKSAYFNPPPVNNTVHLENGLELWSGTGARVTPTDGFGITIRFIKKHLTFIRGGMNLADFIRDISPRQFRLNNSRLSRQDLRRLSNSLKGIKVTPAYARYPRKLTIAKISNSDANTSLDNRNDTVRKYLEQYGVDITRPRLNCVELTNDNLIPIELLKVMPNQPHYDNDDAKLQADVIKKSCINPNNWIREIRNTKDDVAEGAGEFEGILDASIDNKFEETSGIVLDFNRIEEYFQSNDISIRIIVLRGCDEAVIDFFKSKLHYIARGCGIYIDYRVYQHVHIDDLDEFLSDHHHNIIIGKELDYGWIKLLELSGCYTQCLKYSTLSKLYNNSRNERMVSNTIKNILYKINIKAGGENWRIRVQGNWPRAVFRKPVMIIGADVTHFNDGSPSIAAVVCNSSQFEFTAGSSYNFKISVQYPPENRNSIEYIKDMEKIMKSLLLAFYLSTGLQKPDKIIYYRDGVSMGQFETIVLEELNAIQEACTCLEEEYQPKISIVVCTKRHGQRFVTKNRRNPDIGTVVSKDLVTPNYFNFYLFSQNVFQGIVNQYFIN